MVRPIQYEEYDKISDEVLYLGSYLYLRMNVSLSSKNQDQRYHFHKEYKYDSSYGDLRSIKRSFTYYLTLEKTDIRSSGIMIRPQDMIVVREQLNKVSLWFGGDTFGLKDKKELIVRQKKKSIIINGLANQKYIQFDPVVLVYENTREQTPGVRITLGDPSIFTDISADKFFALHYTLSDFNMYLSAQLLVNYLGRPDFGTNLYTVQNELPVEPQDKMIGAKQNRTIPTKNKSFFDKANDMME